MQNTTERFVAYSKHHKALCGALYGGIIPWKLDRLLIRKYLTVIFWTNLVFLIFYTTKRFGAYLKHHKALCGLFKTPRSALWFIQNTNKSFVVVIIIIAILSVEVGTPTRLFPRTIQVSQTLQMNLHFFLYLMLY